MARPKHNTALVHADHKFASEEVAPSISTTTTFKHANVYNGEKPWDPKDQRAPTCHVYSRYTQNVSTRAEHVLSSICGGHAVTYASGLAASYAALIFYQPQRIAITGGYHGVHQSIELYKRSKGLDLKIIDISDEFKQGDLCWLETPLNPTGESRDIKYYADKIHAVGGRLVVDSTFGPPPLQDPFKWGADCILHSGSKYFGGHSDLLCGVLVVRTPEEWDKLQHDRTYLGSMCGNLESWLLLRSLRTLSLRVLRQSENAFVLAQWLAKASEKQHGGSYDGVPGGLIEKVWHSSLQGKDKRGFDPKIQMEGGWNATFSILLRKPEHAASLPFALKYFTAATSLGGVESLIEQRVLSSPGDDPRIVRISVGIEDVEDLKDDLRRAFNELKQAKAKL